MVLSLSRPDLSPLPLKVQSGARSYPQSRHNASVFALNAEAMNLKPQLHKALPAVIPMAIATALFFELVFLNLVLQPADHSIHLRWVQQFFKALAEGVLYPRWAYASHGGLGDPTFFYYQPLFYYCTALVSFFTNDHVLSIKIISWLSNVAVGIITYFVFRNRLSGWKLWMAVLFVQALPLPFFLTTYLGTLPWAFATPFIILFAVESTRDRPQVAKLGLWLSFVVFAHLLSAMMLLTSIGLAFGVGAILRGKIARQRAFRWGLGVGLGLLLSGIYLYPALTQQALINPDGWVHNPTLDWRRAFAFPLYTYTIYGFRWFTVQWPVPLLIALIAGAALVLNYKSANPDPTARYLALFSLGALFLSSELAYPLYEHVSALRKVQHPYRFTVPASIFAAISLALSIDKASSFKSFAFLGRHQHAVTKLIVLTPAVLSLILTVLFQIRLFSEGQDFPNLKQVMDGRFGQVEYHTAGRKDGWANYLDSGGWAGECKRLGLVCTEEKRATHSWSANVVSGTPQLVKLPLFNFPAWEALINGQEISTQTSPDEGLIQIELPAGEHHVEIVWRKLPAENYGIVLSVLGLLGLGFCHLKGSRSQVGL